MASKLDELQQKIAALQQEHDDLLANQKAEAIEQINAMLKTYGIKPHQLDFGGPTVGRNPIRTPSKIVVKYRSESGAWSGRGRKPKWVEDHLKSGGTLDDFLVK